METKSNSVLERSSPIIYFDTDLQVHKTNGINALLKFLRDKPNIPKNTN